VIVDSAGAVIFEAAAGEVAAGRVGPVCDPPPVCPPGQELDPAANRCVDVSVSIPPPPPPAAPLPPLPVGPSPPRPPAGCRGAATEAGQGSSSLLRKATLCLINHERARRGMRRLRVNGELELAARRHARDMVTGRFFAHQSPRSGGIVDRLLRTRYLRRYGRWRVGEILGWGWGSRSSPAAIVSSWMRSPGHRRQLLGPYTELGLSVHRGGPRRMRAPSATFVVAFGAFER
jgi:uncharacterized protein YkwD